MLKIDKCNICEADKFAKLLNISCDECNFSINCCTSCYTNTVGDKIDDYKIRHDKIDFNKCITIENDNNWEIKKHYLEEDAVEYFYIKNILSGKEKRITLEEFIEYNNDYFNLNKYI